MSSMSTSDLSGIVDDTEIAAHAHVLLHAQPERGDDAALGDRRVGDLLDAVQVAGEAGGDDPLPALLGEQRRAAPRRRWSRSARDPCSSALVESASSRRMPSLDAIAPMRARSVRRPSTGVRSSLKSPECRITPCGVWTAIAWACGTRVGDGDELDVERPDHAPLAVVDDDQLGLAQQPGLLDAVAGQAERDRRAVDREAQLAQQVVQRADVVLVAVGGDDSLRCGRRSRAAR